MQQIWIGGSCSIEHGGSRYLDGPNHCVGEHLRDRQCRGTWKRTRWTRRLENMGSKMMPTIPFSPSPPSRGLGTRTKTLACPSQQTLTPSAGFQSGFRTLINLPFLSNSSASPSRGGLFNTAPFLNAAATSAKAAPCHDLHGLQK